MADHTVEHHYTITIQVKEKRIRWRLLQVICNNIYIVYSFWLNT